jgi:hypothetical protein
LTEAELEDLLTINEKFMEMKALLWHFCKCFNQEEVKKMISFSFIYSSLKKSLLNIKSFFPRKLIKN